MGGLENSNTSCAGIWKYVCIYYSFSQQMLLSFYQALALYLAGNMHACVLAKSLSCARLFVTPWNCSPPGSSVHGILQARMLEWVTISSFRGTSPPRDGSWVSCISCACRRILHHWSSLGWYPSLTALLASLSWNSSLSSAGPSFLAHSAVSSNLESAPLTVNSDISHSCS